jgi:hypothetical protein
VHGVVRWRRVDLQRLIAERFGVAYHERTVGKILHKLGFRHISARPRHPAQVIGSWRSWQAGRDLVPRSPAGRYVEEPGRFLAGRHDEPYRRSSILRMQKLAPVPVEPSRTPS